MRTFLSRVFQPSKWVPRSELVTWKNAAADLSYALIRAQEERDEAFRLADDLKSAGRLLTMENDDGGLLIQGVVKY